MPVRRPQMAHLHGRLVTWQARPAQELARRFLCTDREDRGSSLRFGTRPRHPYRLYPVNEEVKIVWRSTGAGSFSIEADGPSSESIDPVWGSDPHDSSRWDRPGKEWGTGWLFPSVGCWTFDVSHGDLAAQMGAAVFTPTESDDQ